MKRLIVTLLVLVSLLPGTGQGRAAGSLQLVVDPDDGVAPLVTYINAAAHTLDGEVYLATSKPVLSALESAASRHVTVRINLDPHPYGTPRATVQATYTALSSHGVQVRWTSPGFTYLQVPG